MNTKTLRKNYVALTDVERYKLILESLARGDVSEARAIAAAGLEQAKQYRRIDMSTLSIPQLERLARGDDPATVLAW